MEGRNSDGTKKQAQWWKSLLRRASVKRETPTSRKLVEFLRNTISYRCRYHFPRRRIVYHTSGRESSDTAVIGVSDYAAPRCIKRFQSGAQTRILCTVSPREWHGALHVWLLGHGLHALTAIAPTSRQTWALYVASQEEKLLGKKVWNEKGLWSVWLGKDVQRQDKTIIPIPVEMLQSKSGSLLPSLNEIVYILKQG